MARELMYRIFVDRGLARVDAERAPRRWRSEWRPRPGRCDAWVQRLLTPADPRLRVRARWCSSSRARSGSRRASEPHEAPLPASTVTAAAGAMMLAAPPAAAEKPTVFVIVDYGVTTSDSARSRSPPIACPPNRPPWIPPATAATRRKRSSSRGRPGACSGRDATVPTGSDVALASMGKGGVCSQLGWASGRRPFRASREAVASLCCCKFAAA
jgi:hypothetical protein